MTRLNMANSFLMGTMQLCTPGAQTDQLRAAQQALADNDLKTALVALDHLSSTSFNGSPEAWLAAAARHFLR